MSLYNQAKGTNAKIDLLVVYMYIFHPLQPAIEQAKE